LSSLASYHPHLPLLSFPTRRSSDLTLPRFDSPLLRHFIIGQLLARPDSLHSGAQFLAGQLAVQSVHFDDYTFEVLASFRGSPAPDRKSTRLNSSHRTISYAVFCLKK